MAVEYQRRLIRKLVVVNPFIALVSHASLLVSYLLCITFTSFPDPKSCCAASFRMGKSVSSSRISNAQSRGVSTIKCLQPSTRTTTTATVALFSSVDGIRSSVKGILFDIDGTLANSWRLGYDATQVVLQNNGIAPITEDVYHDHTRYCTPDRMARHAGYVPEDGPKFIAVGKKLGKEFDDLYVNLVSTKATHCNNKHCIRSSLYYKYYFRYNTYHAFDTHALCLHCFTSGIYRDRRILSWCGRTTMLSTWTYQTRSVDKRMCSLRRSSPAC